MTIKEKNWGGKFFDFRGVLLNDLSPDFPTSPKLVELVRPKEKFKSEEVLRILDKLWPLARSMRPRVEKQADCPEFRKPEYSVSRFQSRRALYISSLGPTWPESPESDEDLKFSVRYILLVKYRSKRMLGRLVDRLHRAGCMRIAAVRDLEGVNTANNLLDEIRLSFGMEAKEDDVNKEHNKLRL